jgi:prepilin-type processing-associated H-X9-DG protein
VGNYLETGPMNGTCSLHVLGDDKCYGGGAVAPTASTGMILDPVFPTGRHLGGSCFTFADGHAKWMPGTLVSTGAVNGYGATFQAGQWWADSPKAAQKKGMVTFATQ